MNNTVMHFTTRFLTTCTILAFACCCRSADADLIVDFSVDNGNSFADSFDVQTGDSLNIGIYLRQTAPDTILTEEGLVSWGFDLTRERTNLGEISNLSTNPVFDLETRNVTTASGFEWEYSDNTSVGLNGDAIMLGAFQFDSTAEGLSVFTIKDRLIGSGAGNANWITPAFSFLDEDIFGAGAADTIQFSVNAVSAVPEPNSFALLSCIAGLVIVRRRRAA